jgi:hypothetical protein
MHITCYIFVVSNVCDAAAAIVLMMIMMIMIIIIVNNSQVNRLGFQFVTQKSSVPHSSYIFNEELTDENKK